MKSNQFTHLKLQSSWFNANWCHLWHACAHSNNTITNNHLQRAWKAFMELRYDRLSMQKICRIENPRTFSLSESSCATRSAFNRIVHHQYIIQKPRYERRMTVCNFCRVQCTGADGHHSTVQRYGQGKE